MLTPSGCPSGHPDGVYRAAVGGVPDLGVPPLRLGDDGGGPSDDTEDLRRGIGAHTAGDAAFRIHSDGHGQTSFFVLSP